MANPIVKVQEFTLDVWTELKKCSWPTRKELVDSTLVVTVTIVVLGIFVAIADLIFLRLVALLTQG